ncbi:MAG: hypothetical protein IKV57_02920 [Clostridia bacterium]|nr:hypothetical protein [Clostridia bacterium]
MTLSLTENRKHGLKLILWWLAVLYAFFCMIHPFLIGCDCPASEHTCGVVQYYASIGSVGWMVLLPLGMVWFSRRENMLIFLLILVFIPLVCVMFLLFAPSLGWLTGDISVMCVPEFGITLAVSLPLVPYLGLLPLLGAGARSETLYRIVFLYCLAAAVYGIYRYRNRDR